MCSTHLKKQPFSNQEFFLLHLADQRHGAKGENLSLKATNHSVIQEILLLPYTQVSVIGFLPGLDESRLHPPTVCFKIQSKCIIPSVIYFKGFLVVSSF